MINDIYYCKPTLICVSYAVTCLLLSSIAQPNNAGVAMLMPAVLAVCVLLPLNC